MNIRVLLVEDDIAYRMAAARFIDGLPGVRCAGSAGNGLEAINKVLSLKPDLVLMDIAMPKLNGFEATRRIKRLHAPPCVVMLCVNDCSVYRRHSQQVGADGYLPKAEFTAGLAGVIRQLIERGAARRGAELPTAFERLSPRQREILQLIATGCPTQDIARRLDLSVTSVEAQRSALMKTLDLHDVAGLMRYAVHAGLIAPP